ncbi:tRNA uridine-5-carboxymethylaminomethyl(34) synthesis GTPase MnmE [Pseudonocardia sp. TMWB2A]|uniref:tRNA uridine-5-carboxymethylaminomethyl(34) synthesis GTPase MnmE n=1 Tax=Pseudonocardia sp. TMWB2A TaxID=687430 RepID=UPI00307D0073
MSDDTIFALSSGQPPAAIAIIRISGPHAEAAVRALAGDLPPPRSARLRHLKHADGVALDQALLLWFPGSRTATGEPLAELHLHGGRAVVRAVENALAALPNLRAAEPGEFTRRAFANGVIDLAEAEGLADLLSAETEAQRRNAIALADGHLSRAVEGWQDELLRISALVEADLDFSDEDDVDPARAGMIEAAIAGLNADMEEWLLRPPVERLKDGLLVVLAGPPNAGKSTLINALAQREAVITSDIAGTTRDVVEIPVSVGGVAMRLADTAGLRDETGDVIEAMGIERARAMVDAADILVWLGPVDDAPDHPALILVAPQADRYADDALWQARAEGADVILSAQSGEGMGALVDAILAEASSLLPMGGEIALNERQRIAIAEAVEVLTTAHEQEDLLIIAERLRIARAALDRLTGKASTEHMLDALFGRFCIGK